jgi:hypothetical protein
MLHEFSCKISAQKFVLLLWAQMKLYLRLAVRRYDILILKHALVYSVRRVKGYTHLQAFCFPHLQLELVINILHGNAFVKCLSTCTLHVMLEHVLKGITNVILYDFQRNFVHSFCHVIRFLEISKYMDILSNITPLCSLGI